MLHKKDVINVVQIKSKKMVTFVTNNDMLASDVSTNLFLIETIKLAQKNVMSVMRKVSKRYAN